LSKETIILVHGLWMNGLDMTLLRQRLVKQGYQTFQFSYPTVRRTPLENAMALHAFIKKIDSPSIHFVCHSLGGLVIRHLFHEYPDQKPGRIVTMGTPHRPSSSAKQLSRFLPGQIILGKSLVNGLLGNIPRWKGERELGSIAGTLQFGMGMIIPNVARPNDGTVAVEETKLEGMTDHIVLHVSHFGLLVSAKASQEVCYFFQHGKFS